MFFNDDNIPQQHQRRLRLDAEHNEFLEWCHEAFMENEGREPTDKELEDMAAYYEAQHERMGYGEF